jgi:hypothetical protein
VPDPRVRRQERRGRIPCAPPGEEGAPDHRAHRGRRAPDLTRVPGEEGRRIPRARRGRRAPDAARAWERRASTERERGRSAGREGGEGGAAASGRGRGPGAGAAGEEGVVGFVG